MWGGDAPGCNCLLEILDAQVSLTRARFNVVNALAEYNSARAMWLRATGRVRYVAVK